MPWERCALKLEVNQKKNHKMKTHKFFKRHKTYLPSLLRPSEVRMILEVLNITWQTRQVKDNGWVNIRSPFREDKNPSFSLNTIKGCFKDFANPEIKGDIVQLVMLANKCSKSNAEDWISQTVNLNTKINLNI